MTAINYTTPVVRFQVVREASFKRRPAIGGSDDAKKFCQAYADSMGFDREVFTVVALDTKHRPIAIQNVTTGTLDASLVHPREVFKLAIAHSASAIIVSHNHPSGETTPSSADIAVTNRLVEAGKLLGIAVLDHVITGDEPRSMADRMDCRF